MSKFDFGTAVNAFFTNLQAADALPRLPFLALEKMKSGGKKRTDQKKPEPPVSPEIREILEKVIENSPGGKKVTEKEARPASRSEKPTQPSTSPTSTKEFPNRPIKPKLQGKPDPYDKGTRGAQGLIFKERMDTLARTKDFDISRRDPAARPESLDGDARFRRAQSAIIPTYFPVNEAGLKNVNVTITIIDPKKYLIVQDSMPLERATPGNPNPYQNMLNQAEWFKKGSENIPSAAKGSPVEQSNTQYLDNYANGAPDPLSTNSFASASDGKINNTGKVSIYSSEANRVRFEWPKAALITNRDTGKTKIIGWALNGGVVQPGNTASGKIEESFSAVAAAAKLKKGDDMIVGYDAARMPADERSKEEQFKLVGRRADGSIVQIVSKGGQTIDTGIEQARAAGAVGVILNMDSGDSVMQTLGLRNGKAIKKTVSIDGPEGREVTAMQSVYVRKAPLK